MRFSNFKLHVLKPRGKKKYFSCVKRRRRKSFVKLSANIVYHAFPNYIFLWEDGKKMEKKD